MSEELDRRLDFVKLDHQSRAKLKEMKGENAEQKLYFDGTSIPETPEKKIMDALGVLRPCCRKHFLTQVDLIEKI